MTPEENSPEPVTVEPSVSAVEVPQNPVQRSRTLSLILGITVFAVFGIATSFYLQSRNTPPNENLPTPSVTATVTSTPSVTVTVEISATPTTTSAGEKATITGGLSYPSEVIPAMSVCAVDTTSKKETCVKTKANQATFSLSVTQGSYTIYSAVDASLGNLKAYYTKCDTYKDSFIPECNPNAGPEEDNGKWNDESFICYEDTVCKNAFTPLVIAVATGESKKLSTIVQGWYIPCSHDEATCNDPSFDVWSDYVK